MKIINKKNRTGYIRFENGLWHTFTDKEIADKETANEETLKGWLEYICTNALNFRRTNINLLIKDILENNYDKDFKLKDVECYKFILSGNKKHLLFNTKDITLINIDDISDTCKIPLEPCTVVSRKRVADVVYTTREMILACDKRFGDRLITYMGKKNTYEYRKFMYNLIVKRKRSKEHFHWPPVLYHLTCELLNEVLYKYKKEHITIQYKDTGDMLKSWKREKTKQQLTNFLHNFYRNNNPALLDKIPEIVSRFVDNPDNLYNALGKKYGKFCITEAEKSPRAWVEFDREFMSFIYDTKHIEVLIWSCKFESHPYDNDYIDSLYPS